MRTERGRRNCLFVIREGFSDAALPQISATVYVRRLIKGSHHPLSMFSGSRMTTAGRAVTYTAILEVLCGGAYLAPVCCHDAVSNDRMRQAKRAVGHLYVSRLQIQVFANRRCHRRDRRLYAHQMAKSENLRALYPPKIGRLECRGWSSCRQEIFHLHRSCSSVSARSVSSKATPSLRGRYYRDQTDMMHRVPCQESSPEDGSMDKLVRWGRFV